MKSEDVARLLIPGTAVTGASMLLGKGKSPIPVTNWFISYDYGTLNIYAGEDSVYIDINTITRIRHYRKKRTIVISNSNELLNITLSYDKCRVALAEWSGSWPCLCAGSWSLTINGVDCTSKIPPSKRNQPMNTFGTYSSWSFGSYGEEEWEEYEDGLEKDAWIAENKNWLKKLPLPENQYDEVYEAFRECDFRIGSCGGCI